MFWEVDQWMNCFLLAMAQREVRPPSPRKQTTLHHTFSLISAQDTAHLHRQLMTAGQVYSSMAIVGIIVQNASHFRPAHG